MKTEILKTKRLLLKKLTTELFEFLFNSHSNEDIIEFLGLADEEELVKEKEKFNKGYETYDRTYLVFLMVLKDSAKVIGRCGYHKWFPDHKRAEIGYALSDQNEMGKGYMKEAVSTVLGYGFNSMGLNRIEAFTSPVNDPSISILKKYGFTKEGYLRDHVYHENKADDSILFSLLKEEYEMNNHK